MLLMGMAEFGYNKFFFFERGGGGGLGSVKNLLLSCQLSFD